METETVTRDPEKQPSRRRQKLRLEGYDYAQEEAYFVTICTHEREHLLGSIHSGRSVLNELGRIVQTELQRTPSIRPNVELDSYVVMPDHVHAILIILERRGVLQYAPTTPHLKSPSQTIGAMVRGFKGSTTKQINIHRGTPGTPVWQRNYYEHVIRNERDLHETRQYIQNNPMALHLNQFETMKINHRRQLG